jgi:hypothetical protein
VEPDSIVIAGTGVPVVSPLFVAIVAVHVAAVGTVDERAEQHVDQRQRDGEILRFARVAAGMVAVQRRACEA